MKNARFAAPFAFLAFSFLNSGNMTSTEAGKYELASYEYGENNGKLKKITYSNGLVVEYSYNSLEKLEKVWYTKNGTRTLAYEYEYTADGKLHTLKNNLSGRTLLYKYDINGKLVTYREYTNDALDFTYASDYAVSVYGLSTGLWIVFVKAVSGGGVLIPMF